jgi:hypothetical protein
MRIPMTRSMILFENIDLSEKETKDITQYEKSFGKAWTERMLRQKRARKYLDEVCEPVKEKCSRATPYRCYVEGTDTYRRKDGLPIRDDDLEALRAIDNGQSNIVRASASGMEMTHSWVCDSSD